MKRSLGPLVAAAAALAFLPVLDNGFVNWDDPEMLLDNLRFRGLGWENIRWAFTNIDFHGLYHPLAWLGYSLDHALWGMEPGGYHLTSLLLHAANAWLLFRLARRLIPDAVAPLFAALLFAVHPLRAEAVAWASARRDLLAAFFSLACVEAYLVGRLRASLALFVAALLSKATAMTLPFVLLVLDSLVLKRKRAPSEKLPFFAVAAVFALIAFGGVWLKRTPQPVETYGLSARLAQSAYGLILPLGQTLFSLRLSPYYEAPARFDLLEARFLLSGLAVLALSAAAWTLRRRKPGLLAAWASYALLMAPTVGVLKAGGHLAADRFSYLPSAVVCLALAAALSPLLAASGRQFAWAGAAAWLIGMGSASHAQSKVWRDSESLWKGALAADGGNSWALANLAGLELERGQNEAARVLALQALEANPDNSFAHGNLGLAQLRLGRREEALESFKTSLRLSPQAKAHRHLGLVLTELGRLDEAAKAYEEAARLDPADADSRYGLGLARETLGLRERAERDYREAIRLSPRHPQANNNLGLLLARGGRPAEARERYRAALQGRPRFALVHYNWANLESQAGRHAVAERLYLGALRIEPGRLDARFNLGNALARQGRYAEAAREFGAVLKRKPGYPRARESLEAARKLTAGSDPTRPR